MSARSAFELPDYTRLPPEQVEPKTSEVLEQWQTATSRLAMQVENSQGSALAKAEAMYLLGALRASDAVPALIENINFFDHRETEATRISDRGGYVARQALVRIGAPSAEWIYLIIAGNRRIPFSPSQADGFVQVLAAVETPEVALAKLRRGLARAKTAQARLPYVVVIGGFKKRQATLDASLAQTKRHLADVLSPGRHHSNIVAVVVHGEIAVGSGAVRQSRPEDYQLHLRQKAAMQQAGEVRLHDLVPSLALYLDYPQDGRALLISAPRSLSTDAQREDYPAFDAIVAIGKAGVPNLERFILSEKPAKPLRLKALLALKAIDAKRAALAGRALAQQFERAGDHRSAKSVPIILR